MNLKNLRIINLTSEINQKAEILWRDWAAALMSKNDKE